MARIMIFSDDKEVFELLGYVLRQEGHRVSVMRGSEIRLGRLAYFGPDLVMIDAVGREVATLGLCKTIRSNRVLTHLRLVIFSGRVHAAYKAELLGIADSLMMRPINPVEVLRGVRMLVEKTPSVIPEPTIESGGLVIDPIGHTVERSGRALPVTRLEFRLLYFLASHPNEVCKMEELFGVVSENPGVTPRTVDLLVRRLRRKLGIESKSPWKIKRARGQGYIWKHF